MVTTELVEGTAGADLAFGRLGKGRAFVVNDQTGFGQGLARTFAERFVHDGGTIIDSSDLGAFDPNQPPDFGARIERARELGAEVLYFAGSEVGAAAALRRAMIARGLPVPLIGAHPLASSQYARLAGDAAIGSYYTLVGPAGFMRDYRAAYRQPAGRISLAAFDATTIVIRALSRAIDDAGGKTPTREQVLTEISRTSNDAGAMGTMSFDAQGDTTLKLLAAYQWVAAAEGTGRFLADLVVR